MWTLISGELYLAIDDERAVNGPQAFDRRHQRAATA